MSDVCPPGLIVTSASTRRPSTRAENVGWIAARDSGSTPNAIAATDAKAISRGFHCASGIARISSAINELA
jgi:hypothetical protein